MGRYIIERNIIDQIPHPLKSNPGNNIFKEGIQLGGSHAGWPKTPPILAPFIVPLALVRRNVIQHVDQKVPPIGLTERSVWFLSAETAIMEKNILSIRYLHPGTSIVPYAIEMGSGFTKRWENQTPDNKPVEIYAFSVTGSPLQFKKRLLDSLPTTSSSTS